MRTKLTVATALAGTVLAACLVSGSAQATSVPVLKGDATPGIVTLVGRGKSGGHGKGLSGGRSGSMKGMSSSRSMKGMSSNRSGKVSRYSRNFPDSGTVKGRDGRDRVISSDKGWSRKGNDWGRKDGGKDKYARKGDHHPDKFKRHRVWRNGAWVWVYGPGYTAYGDDCYWLRRQAIITGSPYWWRRYNLCIGYDYY